MPQSSCTHLDLIRDEKPSAPGCEEWFLSPDVALMHAVGGTVMRGKSAPAPERDSIQTLVAPKCGGEWRLAAFQNTRIRPTGRHTAGTLVWILSDGP